MNEHVGAGYRAGVGNALQSLDGAAVVAVREIGGKEQVKPLVDPDLRGHLLERSYRSVEISLDDALNLGDYLVQVAAYISRVFLDHWQEAPHRKRNAVAGRIEQGV